MATFKILLDPRFKENKEGKRKLVIRASIGNDVIYLNIQKMTEKQFQQVFERNAMDGKSIEFRETCNNYKTKCERICNELKPFDRKRFQELFYEKDKEIPTTLLVKDLFQYFIDNYEGQKLRTRRHYKMTMNNLVEYYPGLTIAQITPDFLRRYEATLKKDGDSQSTVDSLNRDIRRIINYFTHDKKIIPKTYEYPYGKGGYSIKSYFPTKHVI